MLKNLFLALLMVLAAAPAVKAAAATAKPDTDYSIAYVNDYTGDCEVKRKNSDTGEAIEDLYIPLYEGDTLEAGPDSTIEVVFDDSTILQLDPESKLTIRNLIRKDKTSTIVELIKGKVMAIVKKLTEKEEFTVKTKMAMAAVKGTEFIVDTSDSDSVGVYDGAVEVSGLDKSGNVLHKIVVNKDQETTVSKWLRTPGRPGRLRPNFVKRYREMGDLRGKIEMMRQLRGSGRARKYKIERRTKRIENLRTMMRNDPQKSRNMSKADRGIVKEEMRQQPYREAQKRYNDQKDNRDSRMKEYLKKRKPDGNNDDRNNSDNNDNKDGRDNRKNRENTNSDR
jgi:hypothetical protein